MATPTKPHSNALSKRVLVGDELHGTAAASPPLPSPLRERRENENVDRVGSGRIGTIQLFTYTGANLISEYEKDFLEFLNGFVIEPT